MKVSQQSPNQNGSLSIRLTDISKRLSPVFEMHNISLMISPGEFFCLLGPSGSGKSTLLGLIGGWIIPDSGKVILGDTDYTDIPAYQRPIRTCFQKGGFLFPHMSVKENIGYALRVKRMDSRAIEDRVIELMHQVGLDGLGNRQPFQLSGGEAQRVAIARALADPQPILLLDEIQTSLDRHLRSSIRELLIALTLGLRVTTIYVTHDSSEALGLASRLNSRLGIINQGKLEQVGIATEIYYTPQTSFVASLLGDVNLLFVKECDNSRVITGGGNTFILDRPVHKQIKFLAIRSEAITFSPQEGKQISLVGKVETIEFLGGVARIIVRVKDDTITVQQPGTMTAPNIGEEVTCYILLTCIIPLTN